MAEFANSMQTAIAIFAYRRPAHLSKVLNSLYPQLLKINLPVFIFIDGVKLNADESLVRQARQIATSFSDLYGAHLRFSATNKGLYRSLTQGISTVLQDFDSIIVLEDDIKTSEHFLQYMTDGLKTYQPCQKVASIHGYCPPIKHSSMPETFFLRGADCWGWATWRDRWDIFNSDAQEMADQIKSRGLIREFNLNGNFNHFSLLELRANGQSDSWAICWHATCFLADLYTLYPGRSLVKNIGLDSSGEHCSLAPWLDASLSETEIKVTQVPVSVDPIIRNLYEKQVRGPSLILKFLSLISRPKAFLAKVHMVLKNAKTYCNNP